jgi:hypothetical protein
MARRELNFRGITPDLIARYLAELGGREDGEGGIVCEQQGWRAEVTAGEPVQTGSLVLPVTDLLLDGEEASVEALLPLLRRKTFRAGG